MVIASKSDVSIEEPKIDFYEFVFEDVIAKRRYGGSFSESDDLMSDIINKYGLERTMREVYREPSERRNRFFANNGYEVH